jgi:hypothetical protein
MDRAERVVERVIDTVLCIKNNQAPGFTVGGFMNGDNIRRHDAAV